MTTTDVQGSYPKGEERYRMLVEAATDTFARKGFEGTTLKQVADLVGVREATIFHYFASKQELQQAVLAQRDARAQDSADTPEGGISDLLAFSATNGEARGLTKLYAVASVTASDPAHASHRYFSQRYASLVNETMTDIAERQRTGEYRSDIDPQWAARLLLSVFDGLQIQWLYDEHLSLHEGLLQIIALLKP